MDTQQYWSQKHEKYAQQDWITKPTIFASQVVQYFPPSGNILELGCGQGQDSIYFSQEGFQVTACDFSNVALSKARERESLSKHKK